MYTEGYVWFPFDCIILLQILNSNLIFGLDASLITLNYLAGEAKDGDNGELEIFGVFTIHP